MNLQRMGKTLWTIAALALPALAVTPVLSAGSAGGSGTQQARVIVKFKANGALMRESALSARDPDKAQVQHAARMAQRLGMALQDGYAIAPRTQVLFAKNVSSAALVERLRIDPDVEYAEIDERVKRADIPNDQRYSGGQPVTITPTAGQWYLRPADSQFVSAIDAQTAWDTTKGSPAIVVAVLDTGVRPDHPDLVGKLLPGYDFVSADTAGVFLSANDGDGRDADPSDPGDWVTQAESDQTGTVLSGCDFGPSSWHGTQTSALIAAATNNTEGMASVGRNVRVLPVRVLGKCGGYQSDVIAGMYWAAGLTIPASFGSAPVNPTPAKVLNLSLGSATATCGQSYQDAVTAVTNVGASVVVSAGNDAGLAVGQPANCAGAIGVGGLRHTGTKVGFSDVGPQISISAPGGNCVNLSGACLFPILTATNNGTTVPGANTYSDGVNISVGTSFSAPLVSGTVGLMLSINPMQTAAEIRSRLMTSARAFPVRPTGSAIPQCQPPSSTPQDECYCTTTTCGAGMLDSRAAVLAVPAPTTTQAMAFATPASPAPSEEITLDGTSTALASGATVFAYEWTMTNTGGIASFVGVSPVRASTARVNTIGEGTFSVQLKVTDSVGTVSTTTLSVKVGNPPSSATGNSANPSGGGGGSLSWPWLLLLAAALWPLRAAPRRA